MSAEPCRVAFGPYLTISADRPPLTEAEIAERDGAVRGAYRQQTADTATDHHGVQGQPGLLVVRATPHLHPPTTRVGMPPLPRPHLTTRWRDGHAASPAAGHHHRNETPRPLGQPKWASSSRSARPHNSPAGDRIHRHPNRFERTSDELPRPHRHRAAAPYR